MAFDPLSNILSLAGTVIDKIFPDKTEAEKAKVKMAELAMQGQLEELKAQVSLLVGQMNINTEEAKHASWFVAGWRPFIGWVCGSALAYYYILQPFLVWVLDIFNVNTSMPKMDVGELMTVLFGMLGLGAMRTFEKTRPENNGKK
jgi:hypothetical protein